MGSENNKSVLFFAGYNKMQACNDHLLSFAGVKYDSLSFKDHDVSEESPNLYYKGKIIKSCDFLLVKDDKAQRFILKIQNLETVNDPKRVSYPLDPSDSRIFLKINGSEHVPTTYLNPFDLRESATQNPVNFFVVCDKEWTGYFKARFYKVLSSNVDKKAALNYYVYNANSPAFSLTEITNLLTDFYSKLSERVLEDKKDIRNKIALLSLDDSLKIYEKTFFELFAQVLSPQSSREEVFKYFQTLSDQFEMIKDKITDQMRNEGLDHFSKLMRIFEGINSSFAKYADIYKNKAKAFAQPRQYLVARYDDIYSEDLINNIVTYKKTNIEEIDISTWNKKEMLFGCTTDKSNWSLDGNGPKREMVRIIVNKK